MVGPGVLASSGLGLRGSLLLCRPAPLRRPGPPAPHRRALIRAGARCRAGRAGGADSRGPSDGKFVLQTQRSPSPSPTSPPTPSLPPALAAASLPRLSHPGQRAPRCETLRFRAGSAGHGDSLQFGGEACRFPRREGVARGGSRCPACPDLPLGRRAPDPRGSRDWGVGRGQTFLTGGTWALSRDRAVAGVRASRLWQRTCPRARRWREMRRPNSAPLRSEAHTLEPARLYLFSPLTFLLRALGAASPRFAPPGAPAEPQLLTPRRWGKGNPAGGWRSGRGLVFSPRADAPGSGVCNLPELTAVSRGLGVGVGGRRRGEQGDPCFICKYRPVKARMKAQVLLGFA